MAEALLCVPDRFFEPFVNIQKSFCMIPEERTNEDSIISLATTSVAANSSGSGKEE